MEHMKLAELESRFVELVWQREPIHSGELALLCERELHWKKSTTYTVLRRLCQKGILQNQNAVVTALIKKQEYYAIQSEQFVEETFQGSLPQFLTAFMSRKKLSPKQIAQIRQMIDDWQETEE